MVPVAVPYSIIQYGTGTVLDFASLLSSRNALMTRLLSAERHCTVQYYRYLRCRTHLRNHTTVPGTVQYTGVF